MSGPASHDPQRWPVGAPDWAHWTDQIGREVATATRREVTLLATELREELADHERRAAERDRERAEQAHRDLAEIREALAGLAGLPRAVEELASAVARLDGQVNGIERRERDDALRAEGRASALAERPITGVGPSPLVVAASAPPDTRPTVGAWLAQWTPLHAIVLAIVLASAATGQAIPWADLLRLLPDATELRALDAADRIEESEPADDPTRPEPAP